MTKSKSVEKGLWDIAIDKTHTDEEEKASEEASVLFLGSKNSGKTSLILRFLDRDEPPKPTVALEYTFGRRAKGHNIAKDVGHIWELGGGTWLTKLIDAPINPTSIKSMSIVLVLDLSTPNELWYTLETLIKVLRSQVDTAISEARREDPNIKDKLKKKLWERLGEEHPDKDMIDPFPVPLVIIGGKYDVFQDFDSEKRKVMCKTLRFVAHNYGAHLQFFSAKQDALVNRSRALLSHVLFATPGSKNMQADHNKPLLVPWGMDSMSNIGSPPLPDGDIGKVTARNPMELWKGAFTSFFKQENISDPSKVDDPAKDPQYAEPAIDGARKQKDEELERYRRQAERRDKQAQRSMGEGIA